MLKHISICVVLFLATATSSTIEDDGVFYVLYIPKNPNTPINFRLPITGSEGINASLPVKILCHGFTDNSSTSWLQLAKNAYMAKGFYNVIILDWGKYSNETYDAVYLKIPDIGDHVGRMVKSVSDLYNINLRNFHLIGHSLGAHISGFAGKKVVTLTNTNKVGRITGLDPAGPIYDLNLPNARLSNTDASFVDAIHTDAVGFGYKLPIALADFWPNGGSLQNGCDPVSSCSHTRATLYFVESIMSSIPAWKCSSWIAFTLNFCYNNEKAIMGENCKSTSRGNFFLKTNSKSPFGIL